jgi:hypothetical protein
MNLTPHWEQIQQTNPDAHLALQRVASAIYKQAERSIAFKTCEADPTMALELGFLSSEGDQITFSNLEVEYDYLVRHAVVLAIADWDDLKEFTKVINEVEKVSIRTHFQREIEAGMLLVLCYEYDKNIVDRIVELIRQENSEETPKHSLWSLCSTFCNVLPKLSIEPAVLADALEIILQTPNRGIPIYTAIESLAARSQESADALYKEFIVRTEPSVIELALTALLTLAKFSLPQAHHNAVILTDSGTSLKQRIGIAALSRFKYENDVALDLLNITLEKLESFRVNSNPEIDRILPQAYGDLLDQANKAIDAFVELASREDPAVSWEVARVLFLKAKDAYSQRWYRQSLVCLIQMPLLSLDTLKQLDYCITFYAKDDPEAALEMVETIALNWKYSSSNTADTLLNILDRTFAELYNNHYGSLVARFTRWWSLQVQDFHLLAWHMQQYFDSLSSEETFVDIDEETGERVRRRNARTPKLILDKQVLGTLSDQTVVYVLYRICGYVVQAESLSALLLSVLLREPHSPDIAGLVASFLSDYVLYNYPQDGGEYLQQRMEVEGITEIERQVIKTALHRSNSYFDARQNLSRLEELRPPANRVNLLQLAQWKYQNEIMEQAHQRSVFYSLVSHIPLKYGRAFSVMREDGSLTEPSKLATFHHEQEIPQRELIDPLGQTYLRLQWRSAGMDDSAIGSNSEVVGDSDL